jgi:hypothetical protein
MNLNFRLAVLTLALCGAALSPALRAETQKGYLDFGKLPASTTGGEFVEVNVRSNLISMVARLAAKAEPKAAELLRGLHAVHVKVIGLDDGNRPEILKRITEIRNDLDAKGWEKIVSAQKKNEDVAVYLKTRGPEVIEGLVVTVMAGNREAVLVNIVGDIKVDDIATVAERLNIEPLKKIAPILEK